MTTPATLAVGGPTATGKTVLAVELARRLGGELVNADSRQAMRRLRVGTATPTAAELGGVPCHLLDETEPGVPLSVADWLERARSVLGSLDARGIPAVVVGGTGQYMRALAEGWTVGGRSPDPARRAAITTAAASAAGLAELVAELRDRDPEAAATLDTANPRRVIRALELLWDGAPTLAAVRGRVGGRHLALVVLDADRELHGQAIAERVRAMFDGGGLVREVTAELARGTSAAALRRSGIGYGEALDALDGRVDLASAAEETVRRTLRYAKAQRTWFRAQPALLRVVRERQATAAGIADLVLAALRGPGWLSKHPHL